MSHIKRTLEQQEVSAFISNSKDSVIVSIGQYPLSMQTTLTAEQAIDLATELIATANRIQMKEAA